MRLCTDGSQDNIELKFFCRLIPTQKGGQDERTVNARRHAARADVITVNDDAIIAGNGTIERQRFHRCPVNGRLSAMQQPGGTADKGTGTNRIYMQGVRGLFADKRQNRLVFSDFFLTIPSRNKKPSS